MMSQIAYMRKQTHQVYFGQQADDFYTSVFSFYLTGVLYTTYHNVPWISSTTNLPTGVEFS